MSDRRGKSANIAVRRSAMVCWVNLILRMLIVGGVGDKLIGLVLMWVVILNLLQRTERYEKHAENNTCHIINSLKVTNPRNFITRMNNGGCPALCTC